MKLFDYFKRKPKFKPQEKLFQYHFSLHNLSASYALGITKGNYEGAFTMAQTVELLAMHYTDSRDLVKQMKFKLKMLEQITNARAHEITEQRVEMEGHLKELYLTGGK